MNKRIGILGGTFNPVHNGHLHVAKQALKKLYLDKVIFIPTYMPPHKKIQGLATADDRLTMLRLALRNKKKLTLSTYEIKKRGKSYSIKTARHLNKKYGDRALLFFLIGADSLRGLKSWKDITSLRKVVQFAVAPRPGVNAKTVAFPGVLKIDMPKSKTSSTQIRRLVKEGRSIKRFVPKKVLRYIIDNNLYMA